MDIFQTDVIFRLQKIQQILDLTPQEMAILSQPKRISKAFLDIDGEKIPAWRILYNEARGPGKGGIRFHPNVSEEEVDSLAFWMTIKTALTNIPYGGAKGGVKFDPKTKDKKYLEKVSRAYIGKFHQFLGQDKDIPAPDIYTDSQIMAWMLDEYEKITDRHEPGMITGKPIPLGGCSLRKDATARGGYIVLKEFLNSFNFTKKHPIIAIQGFGNAGAEFAKMLDYDGFVISAVVDSKGGIYNPNGIDVRKVIEAKMEKGAVSAYQNGQTKIINNEELLSLDVDILVLAALENQVTEKNVSQIKAKYILELANGPIEPAADKILLERGIPVAPDILANAGGVVVSYFEWQQNKTGRVMDIDALEGRLEEIMTRAWEDVFMVYQEKDRKIDLRTAAYIIAIKRILEAEHLRGHID